jgi:hypothetical protein
MKTLKMSLANIQGKMSRLEMRNIMAGSGSDGCQDTICTSNSDCCTTDPYCRKMANDSRSACYNV